MPARKLMLALVVWYFLHYNPAIGKPGLTKLTFLTEAECDKVRIHFYNKYVNKHGWASFLNNKGWWVSPRCEKMSKQ